MAEMYARFDNKNALRAGYGAADRHQALEEARAVVRKQEMEAQKRELEYKRQAMDAQVAALRAEFEIVQLKALKVVAQDKERARVLADDRVQLAKQRRAGDVKTRKTIKPKSGGSR